VANFLDDKFGEKLDIICPKCNRYLAQPGPCREKVRKLQPR
jgi:hypothetical protein